MRCLLLVLPALFVGSLAAPGGYSAQTGGAQNNSPLNGAPQIIPSFNNAGGYSRQYGNGAAATGAEQAAADQAAAGGFSNTQNAGAGGAPLGGAGAGGQSTNNQNTAGGALGGQGGGASNAQADPLGGAGLGGAGGYSGGAANGGNGLGAPVIIPNQAGGQSVPAGGEVNQAGLLAGQALTAQGMSAGAAAGIAIGVIAVAALGTAVAVMIMRR